MPFLESFSKKSGKFWKKVRETLVKDQEKFLSLTCVNLGRRFKISFYIINLFNTVFYFKLNFISKIEPKTCNFKNLEKIYQKHLAIAYQSTDIGVFLG